MQSRIAALAMMVVLALAPAGFAGGNKSNKASVTFHMETAGTDNPKMIFSQQMANGQERFFLRSPEISISDIATFQPFPSESGQDYGVVFTLKPAAVTKLAAITNTNPGKWMVVQMNGRLVDGVMIDKQIDDGRLVVWQGVTLSDITVLESKMKRTGEDGKKKD
ncbi:MAG: hypothetical protein V4689_03460 [Verrucomicrobiota bacterium]